MLDNFLFPAPADSATDSRAPRVPYARHLHWLTLDGSPEVSIQGFYGKLQLPKPSRSQIEAAGSQEQIKLPPSLLRRLSKRVYTAEDVAYWAKLGLGEIYLQRLGQTTDAPWGEVGALLQDPVQRVAVDCLRLAGLTIPELLELLPQGGYQRVPSQAGVELYERYFFNTAAMTLADWRAYLVSLQEDPYSYLRYQTALTQGVDAVLHLCQLPTRRQYTDYLRSILATAEMKVKHFARLNVDGAENEARRWAKLGMDAGDRFQKFSGKSQGDLLKFIQTEFEYVPLQIEAATEDMMRDALPPSQEGAAKAVRVDPQAVTAQAELPLDGEAGNAAGGGQDVSRGNVGI